jgi:hypothetical protein
MTFTRVYNLKMHKKKKIPCSSKPHTCKYCDKTFAKQSNLTRHIDESCKKEASLFYIEKIKNLEENLIKEKQALDEKYKDIDEKLKNIAEQKVINNNTVNNNNVLNNNTVNILTKEYIGEHFTCNPCLQPLTDYSAIRDGNMITDPHYDDVNIMFVNTIFSQYEINKLVEYVGNILLKFYKNKDDISKQSLWCSDLSRMTFLVRVLPTNATINTWISDPACVNVKETIIKPLLNYILKCIDEYSIKYNYKMITETEKFLVFSDIAKIISNNELTNDVAKYIAPHFILPKKTIKNKNITKK